jgi:aldose 1-epimerase
MGRQWELEGGGYRAVAVEVGGGLRSLTFGGRPLLDGYDAEALADAGRGQLLLPWPNRVAGGRYRFAGREHQLDVSEPATGNAIHGLVRWGSWSPPAENPGLAEGAESAARLVLAHRLSARPAYPFTIDLQVTYQLDERGLTTTVTARNAGSAAAPIAAGAHPYLTAGAASIDECTLHVPADEVLTTDDHQIPDGRSGVAATAQDFRRPRPIGDVVLDTAYTALRRRDDGRAEVRLMAPSGHGTVLWVDASHPYVMVFTGDSLPPERRRQGVAVEPMTAPPNALATGEDLVVLEPGASWSVSWGIYAVEPGASPT